MDDLVQFLRARYDEDEQAARAVGYERIETGEYMWNSKYLLLQSGAGGESKATAEFDGDLADHIARHDPARVLREVEAKRRLLDLHEPGTQEYVDGDVCMACTLTGDGPYYPCATLRLLALPYVDHADYQDDWRP